MGSRPEVEKLAEKVEMGEPDKNGVKIGVEISRHTLTAVLSMILTGGVSIGWSGCITRDNNAVLRANSERLAAIENHAKVTVDTADELRKMHDALDKRLQVIDANQQKVLKALGMREQEP